jgi:GTP cyclohydrolase I
MDDKIFISEERFIQDCARLVQKLREIKTFWSGVYGVPRGGERVAKYVSQELGLPLVELEPQTMLGDSVLVVDDLVDSGKTLSNYLPNSKAVLYRKTYSPQVISVETFDKWIEFWYENTKEDAESLITRELEFIGENPNREGIVETPKRVVKSWKELYAGYQMDPKDMVKVFECEGYQGMVLLKDIEMYSTCEHHMLPFVGKCHIAYIPDKKVIGISKLARIMEVYARRLQIQEKLTDQIADCLMDLLKPKGVAVQIEADHFCMRMRGVGKQNSHMVTTSLRGNFNDNPATRQEFLEAIKK